MALNTTTASGSQTSTQSPQQAPASSTFSAGQQGSAVQPGTPEAALNSSGGLPLQNSALTTINLGANSGTIAYATPAKPIHHTKPALLSVSVILFLVAIVLFWSAARPVKKTSDS